MAGIWTINALDIGDAEAVAAKDAFLEKTFEADYEAKV